MTKRKTLPKNFSELIENKDIGALKDVFKKCDINAYGGYYKINALGYNKITDEFVRWLVEQGADINFQGDYKHMPLHEQVLNYGSNIPLFLELGADINASDYRSETPLHHAAKFFRINAVQVLLKHGANIEAENDLHETPLAVMLSVCRNIDIKNTAEIAELLLKQGASVDEQMKQSVNRIGTDFEFSKANFNKDYLSETEKALSALYKLFNVTPVPQRITHDGRSPITVTSSKWWHQHQELWELLVPASAHAETLQGEVIRITGRLSNEILDNGGVNWDNDFKKMCSALSRYFELADFSKAEEQKEAIVLAKRIDRNSTEKDLARLCELAVQLVIANSKPIKIKKPDYKR